MNLLFKDEVRAGKVVFSGLILRFVMSEFVA